MQRRFDIVLFDLGGVLVELTGVSTMLKWTEADGHQAVEELWRRWLTSPAVRSFERGETAPEQFAATMIEEFGLPVDAVTFLAAFVAWPRGPYPGAAELLQALAPAYTLALLSNTNALHWERVQREMGLLEHFQFAFPSFQTGFIKPDPEAFRHVVEIVARPPERILFLDDNQLNVEGAIAVGMEAYRVQGVEETRQQLRALGLLGPAQADRAG